MNFILGFLSATKAQALEIEKSLLTPAAAETTGDEKRKRPRKPSQKVKENVEGDEGKDQEDVDNDTDQFSQKKRRMNKKGKDTDKEEEKRRETEKKKLQQSVQEERVAKILHGLRKPELVQVLDREEPAMHHAEVTITKTTPAKQKSTTISQSQTTPLVNHSSSTNIISSHGYSPPQATPLLDHSSDTHTTISQTHSPTHNTPSLNYSSRTHTVTSHTYSPMQNTPLLNHSSCRNTILSHTYSPTQNSSAFKHSTGRHTNKSHKHTPLTDHNSHTTLQSASITPPQKIDLDTYPTPLSRHMSPKSFTELLNLVDDDCENVPLADSPPKTLPKTIGNPNWESFASHFTHEFEWLKAEVDGLRNEVKHLRRTVRELKANPSSVQVNASQPQQTQENQLLEMIRNTTKPLDGLKALLYELFTPEEVRQSSLKGRTTVTGGESVGLQRQKLDLIYFVMESRYKMDRLPVDNLIRGQQRKLRAQKQKTSSS